MSSNRWKKHQQIRTQEQESKPIWFISQKEKKNSDKHKNLVETEEQTYQTWIFNLHLIKVGRTTMSLVINQQRWWSKEEHHTLAIMIYFSLRWCFYKFSWQSLSRSQQIREEKLLAMADSTYWEKKNWREKK